MNSTTGAASMLNLFLGSHLPYRLNLYNSEHASFLLKLSVCVKLWFKSWGGHTQNFLVNEQDFTWPLDSR